jgi:regulator of PEP synthase PpsR (kinase-PPPase family)
MDKNEVEERMNAAVDLVAWLNQRIEQQVEQRLEREREYWRGVIIEERKLVSALLRKLITESIQTSMTELVHASHVKMIDRVQEMLDRIEAKLDEPMHRSGDDAPPSPSKH